LISLPLPLPLLLAIVAVAREREISARMVDSDNEEYYAYSSDEDGYPLEDDNASMEWEGSENPNAAPMEKIRREFDGQ
jgi:hypothetical protein